MLGIMAYQGKAYKAKPQWSLDDGAITTASGNPITRSNMVYKKAGGSDPGKKQIDKTFHGLPRHSVTARNRREKPNHLMRDSVSVVNQLSVVSSQFSVEEAEPCSSLSTPTRRYAETFLDLGSSGLKRAGRLTYSGNQFLFSHRQPTTLPRNLGKFLPPYRWRFGQVGGFSEH